MPRARQTTSTTTTGYLNEKKTYLLSLVTFHAYLFTLCKDIIWHLSKIFNTVHIPHTSIFGYPVFTLVFTSLHCLFFIDTSKAILVHITSLNTNTQRIWQNGNEVGTGICPWRGSFTFVKKEVINCMTSLYRCPWKYLDKGHGSGFPNRLYSQSMSWFNKKAANID